MKINPFTDRDLTTRLLWPKLSWSSFNAFVNYDKEEWYQCYVKGQRKIPNASMVAGQIIGERLATDPSYLPEVPRPEIYEEEIEAMFHKISLIGHLDGLTIKHSKILDEYKTSLSDKKWTASTVAKWKQIDFYLLLVWLRYKIFPQDFKIRLTYIPVKMIGSFEVVRSTEPIRVIHTTRTMSQILSFAAEIKKTYKEMCQYVDNHD